MGLGATVRLFHLVLRFSSNKNIMLPAAPLQIAIDKANKSRTSFLPVLEKGQRRILGNQFILNGLLDARYGAAILFSYSANRRILE
jgi:hypothetical protein